MARKWFSRFKKDRFDISDTPHSGRLSGLDEDSLNTLIHNDPRHCTQELANVMNCGHSTIVQHLHSMGNIKKMTQKYPKMFPKNDPKKTPKMTAENLPQKMTPKKDPKKYPKIMTPKITQKNDPKNDQK